MALNFENWSTLTKYALLSKPTSTFFKDLLFGAETTSTTDIVMFEKQSAKDGIARFVPNNSAPAKIVNKGLSSTAYSLKLPITKEKMVFSIDEFNNYKSLGGSVMTAGASDSRVDPFSNWVLSNVDELMNRRSRRIEQMCAQAVSTGKIEVEDADGIKILIDYGFTSDQLLGQLATGSLWSASTSNPVADITDWAMTVAENTGLVADTIIMGIDAWKAYASNSTVMKYYNNLNTRIGAYDPTKIIAKGTGGQAMTQFGADKMIYVYSQKYTEDATVKDVFNSKSVLVTSSQLAGQRWLEYVNGVITRFAKGSFNQVEQSEKLRIDILPNDENSIVAYQLESKGAPLIKVPEGFVVAQVVA